MAGPVSTTPTSRSLKQLLPSILKQIGKNQRDRGDLVLVAWPSLIGEHLASMTQAVSFVDGLLSVKVRNSSLLSLLTQHERPRLLKQLRNKFPRVTIRNIRFYIG